MARLADLNDAELKGSRAARLLLAVKRDMALKKVVFDRRRRNEEILSLAYVDGVMNSPDAASLEENGLNLPYRYGRWIDSQATSKDMVLEVDRDAGAGQVPGNSGGPADDVTGKWMGIFLKRAAYEAGLKREMSAMLGEMIPRGVGVLRVGYHSQALSPSAAVEVGKDAQSVAGDVITAGDVEAKPGQAHAEISRGLLTQAQAPGFLAAAGSQGVAALLQRKDSHDLLHFKEEAKGGSTPIQNTRLTNNRLWIKKLRAGEQVGWSPEATDTAEAGMWWERILFTVREVKNAPDLFTAKFRREVKGYDARNVSGVAPGGQTPSSESMSSDGRTAQGEDILEDDEKIVEVFQCWIRRPDLLAGGLVRRVCAECPGEFIEADSANPHVFPTNHIHAGRNAIPGFFPFVDYTPILGSLMVSERTCGVPPVAVGMPHFEKLVEYNRILHESGLRHSLRLYQLHPAIKDLKKVEEALKAGKDGYSFVCPPELVDSNGQMHPAILPIQFSGNTMEVDRLAAREQSLWVMVMGMPPAVLQGVGTAGTAAQDNMGIAAGERESGSVVGYCEDRTGELFAKLRGLARVTMDDEDFIELLGAEGAKVMKDWQEGATDDGDEIKVTFGATSQAERMARTKQIMEAINLLASQIDPATGMPKYDFQNLLDELMRMLGVGGLKLDAGMMAELQKLAMIGKQAMAMMQSKQPGGGGGGPAPQGGGGAPQPAPAQESAPMAA